jgi:hypothetical protein
MGRKWADCLDRKQVRRAGRVNGELGQGGDVGMRGPVGSACEYRFGRFCICRKGKAKIHVYRSSVKGERKEICGG